MKRLLFLSIIFSLIISSCNSLYRASSYDDVYYSPEKSSKYGNDRYENEVVNSEVENVDYSKGAVVLKDDKFVTSDNSNPAEYSYSSRLKRFYGPMSDIDYSDDLYTGSYYYTQDDNNGLVYESYNNPVNTSISFTFGVGFPYYNYGWGWNSWFNDPWYYPYNSWYYPWGGYYPSWGYPSWNYPCWGPSWGCGPSIVVPDYHESTYGPRGGMNTDGTTINSGLSRPIYKNENSTSGNNNFSGSSSGVSQRPVAGGDRFNAASSSGVQRPSSSSSQQIPNKNESQASGSEQRSFTRFNSALSGQSSGDVEYDRPGKVIKYNNPVTTSSRSGNEYSRYVRPGISGTNNEAQQNNANNNRFQSSGSERYSPTVNRYSPSSNTNSSGRYQAPSVTKPSQNSSNSSGSRSFNQRSNSNSGSSAPRSFGGGSGSGSGSSRNTGGGQSVPRR